MSFAVLERRRLCACSFENELYDKNPWLRPSLRKMGQREGLRLMLIYFESQALMLCYGAVLLRGSDVRSHEDFAAVSHSLNCGTPAPQRSMRNPARASRSFNSVIRLSLAGTMLCGPWLTSWRRDLSRSSGRTETCSQDTFVPLCRVLAMSRGPSLRTSGSQCSPRVAGRYQWRRND